MTKNSRKSNGLLVGAIFTVCSLLLTFTFVVPIISVLPGVLIETISKALVSNEPYSNVGKLTILFLTLIFLLAIILTFIYTRKLSQKNENLSNGKMTLIMFAFYFIVHPLFFYIYWGLNLNFRSDGQLIFAAVATFPVSSFAFVLLGLLIDWIRNTAANKGNRCTTTSLSKPVSKTPKKRLY